MLNGKIQLDDSGYYYSLIDMARAYNSRDDNDLEGFFSISTNVIQWIKYAGGKGDNDKIKTFHSYVTSSCDAMGDGSPMEDEGLSRLHSSWAPTTKGIGDINAMLGSYHFYKCIYHRAITYKIRPKMVDFFESSKLDFPARLFLTPHDEFMISLPIGAVETELGSLVNIFVSTEDFDYSAYKDGGQITTQKNISDLIANNPDKIKRMIRCYAICYDKNNLDVSTGKTVYYQLPILEDEKIYDQFLSLMETSGSFIHKNAAIKMFDIVLKFCAYLIGSKCPDMVRVPGSIRQPKAGNVKKEKQADKHNAIHGYDFFDVGRICQSNPSEVEYIRDAHGVLKKHFKVRRHYRAQWYGAKSEESPSGTHQSVIVIEEFEKGDLGKEMKPKINIV